MRLIASVLMIVLDRCTGVHQILYYNQNRGYPWEPKKENREPRTKEKWNRFSPVHFTPILSLSLSPLSLSLSLSVSRVVSQLCFACFIGSSFSLIGGKRQRKSVSTCDIRAGQHPARVRQLLQCQREEQILDNAERTRRASQRKTLTQKLHLENRKGFTDT